MNAENLIFKMLTTSTGSALCDSGGAYGRNWERNQKKTIEDFRAEPECYLEVDHWKDGQYSFTPTISLFHRLKSCLELDQLCNEFNAMPVDDWRGDYYGVSDEGMEWLENVGFEPEGDSFNSYNWDCINSQVTQGQALKLDGENYVLLQIHQGCDVRGGYTDAKLFKLKQFAESWALFDDLCMFDLEGVSVDYIGQSGFLNSDGDMLDTEQLNQLASKCTKTIYHGYINSDF